MKNKIYFYRTCPRCNTKIRYLHKKQIKESELIQPNWCKCCKGVPDNYLPFFIFNKQYIRRCPICHREVSYKDRRYYFHTLRKNGPCKKCMNIKNSIRKLNEELTPIIGTWRPSKRIICRIRKHWKSLPQTKKDIILSRDELHRKMYFEHLPRMQRSITKRNVRLAFEKYRGDNHWFKRPDVLKKIKKSCEKYRGDNHWFRNPNYVKKNVT